MAYRIKDFPSTAATPAADDFLPLDGATNGPRKFALKAALDSLALPSQTGNSGKYLTTDGSTASWGTVSGGGTWGSITGTLSSQTDLQAALNAKASLSGAAFTGDISTTGAFTITGSVGAATSTNLSLSGGSNGANITLGQGSNGWVTVQPKGTGTILLNPNAPALDSVFVKNSSNTGYSTIAFADDAGTTKGYVGYANSGATYYTSKVYLYSYGTLVLSSGTNPALTLDASQNGAFAANVTVAGTLSATGAISQNGNQVLHAGNFSSYAPSLTGTGASGTWGISISGNAANVTGTVALANGGTGATDAGTARTNLGLGSVATQAASNVALTGGSAANLKVLDLIEDGTASATAATGALNYDVKTQTLLLYTSNASGNWTLNIRGDASTTLDSLMAVGDSITLAFLVTQGATPYYCTAITIDGNANTPKWQGGTAPTAGNASGIDGYSYTVIKTASATFTVLAAQTQFK